MGPAVELARYARENIGPHGDEDGGAYWYICAALAAAEQPDATSLFDEALDEARVRGSLFTVGEALTLRSAVLLRRAPLQRPESPLVRWLQPRYSRLLARTIGSICPEGLFPR